MKDFHVILPSNTPGNNNVANHFITPCNQHINLEGEWRVGLSEISFYKNNISLSKGVGFETSVQCEVDNKIIIDVQSLTFTQIQSGNFYLVKEKAHICIARNLEDIKYLTKIVIYLDDDDTIGTPYVISYSPELKDNLDMVYVDTIPFAMRDVGQGDAYEQIKELMNIDKWKDMNWKGVFPIKLVLDTTKKIRIDEFYFFKGIIRTELKENKHFTDVGQMTQELTKLAVESRPNLLRNMDFCSFLNEGDRVKCILGKSVRKFKFNGGLHFVLGFQFPTLYASNNLADYSSQLHRGIGSMYVYSNICDNTQVGNVLVPLLRQIVLPPPSKPMALSGMIEKITFDSPMYVPVRLTTINSIEIEVRTNTGDYFPFTEDSVTTVTLHFKKEHE